MANYSYIGKGVVTLKEGANPDIDLGNVSKLTLAITEEKKTLLNSRSGGGGNYNAISRITGVEAQMTLHDMSPDNLAILTRGISTSALGDATIEAMLTAGKEFKLVFTGLNEAASGKSVVVTVHKFKPGTTQGLDFIGDDFWAGEVAGECVADTSKNGTTVSQYFNVVVEEIT